MHDPEMITPAFPGWTRKRDADSRDRPAWAVCTLIYALFAAAVFTVHGSRPPLGPDHLSYIQLADSILAACTAGDYWRETSSIRFFGVLLAYLHDWTGSHILSMKIVLAVFSVFFLLASQLFFELFTPSRRQAILFALLSGFAVSFGFASWGVTDATALLPRTLVAPVVMLSMWVWFRFDGGPAKYLAFSLLTLASVLHLSTFYAIGVLLIVEIWDFGVLRRMRIDARMPALLGGLLLALTLLAALEYVGLANKSMSQHMPETLRAMGARVDNIGPMEHAGFKPCPARIPPADGRASRAAAKPKASADLPQAGAGRPKASSAPPKAGAAKPAAPNPLAAKTVAPNPQPARPVAPNPQAAKPAAPKAEPAKHASPPKAADARAPGTMSSQEAWAAELSTRPWRNMPMPAANIANAFSSSALILLLAVVGMLRARRTGFTRADHLMLAMFVAVPIFAFVPQTALWMVRSFKPIYPATIEEVRALSLIMVPSLYFILRLFRLVVESGAPRARLRGAAVIAAVLALPLFMKNLPAWSRERLLDGMIALNLVDRHSEASIANARAALGIAGGSSSLYYSTRGVREWIARNTPPGIRILTDRDDLVLLRDRVILGPRQVAVNIYKGSPDEASLFLETSQAMAAKDLAHLRQIASAHDADALVVDWRVEGAPYADDAFSVILLDGRSEARQ